VESDGGWMWRGKQETSSLLGKYEKKKNIFFPNLTLSYFPIANMGARRSLYLHKHQQLYANTISKDTVLSMECKLEAEFICPNGRSRRDVRDNLACLISTDKKTEFPRGKVICPQLLSGRAGKRTLISWLSVK